MAIFNLAFRAKGKKHAFNTVLRVLQCTEQKGVKHVSDTQTRVSCSEVKILHNLHVLQSTESKKGVKPVSDTQTG